MLTIITINLNNESGVRKTINSLAPIRAHPEVSFLFIDGRSSDQSVSLASRFYGEEEIISESDSGIYEGMNKGLYLAKTKWVLWLNSGDELHEEFTEGRFLKELQRTSADVLCGCVDLYRGEDFVHKRVPQLTALPLHTFPHSGAAFRRSVLEAIGGYNESYSICADRDLFVRLFLLGFQIKTSDETVVKFYHGGISTSMLRRRYFENNLIDYRNRIVSYPKFLGRLVKSVFFARSIAKPRSTYRDANLDK